MNRFLIDCIVRWGETHHTKPTDIRSMKADVKNQMRYTAQLVH